LTGAPLDVKIEFLRPTVLTALRTTRPPLVLLLAAAACAHASPDRLSRAGEPVAVGDAVVVLRQDGDDPAVADQLRRVLPRAVEAATRWGPLPSPVVLTVHATHAGLEAATGRAGRPWMRAWARERAVDVQSPRTWSRGYASDGALAQVLAHELTHCVLFEIVARDGRAPEIPLWFVEGMASVTAGERHDAASADAVTASKGLMRRDPKLVYGTADRAFRELVLRFGEGRVRALLAHLAESHAFPVAFREVMGVTLAEFEDDLQRRLSGTALRG
jgi:hypothetical protein